MRLPNSGLPEFGIIMVQVGNSRLGCADPVSRRVAGFRVRSFSDKIDFVNFAQNSRPGMTTKRILQMLRENINNAVKDAMRAKDERKLSTLRMVNSTIKNADIAARGEGKPPLSDADLLGVFQKMIKQRQESVELYDKGGRAELAAQEREEIAIIQAYLPKQMSDDDVKAAIAAVISETGAAGMKDMGKVIGALKTKYAGQMDFGKASGLVKAALT
jgi:uncharacterized protein YqeY